MDERQDRVTGERCPPVERGVGGTMGAAASPAVTGANVGAAAPNTRPPGAYPAGATRPASAAYGGVRAHEDLDEKDSDEIRRDIEYTRADLDYTIDSLQARLDPRYLLSQVGGMFSDGGGAASRRVVGAVRDHPVPAALFGLGALWLLMDRRARQADHYEVGRGREDDWLAPGATYTPGREAHAVPEAERRYQYQAERYGAPRAGYSPYAATTTRTHTMTERISGAAGYSGERATDTGSTAETARSAASTAGSAVRSAASAVGDTASRAASAVGSAASRAGEYITDAVTGARHYVADAGHAARERTGHLGHTLGDTVSDWGYYARERAHDLGETTRYAAKRSRQQFWQTYDTNPLAIGAAAFALGLIGGLLIPSTRRERRMIGPYRDQFIETARTVGREALRAGSEVGRDTWEAAREAARREDLTPEGLREEGSHLAEKAKHVVQTAVEKGKESAREHAQEVAEKARDKASQANQSGRDNIPGR